LSKSFINIELLARFGDKGMKPLTKAQITIGLLAFFASVWGLIVNQSLENITDVARTIIIVFISIMALAYVLLAILEWIKVFDDLETNAILTLIVIVTMLLGVFFRMS